MRCCMMDRWSFSLVISGQAKACIRVGWRTSWRCEMQQSWCSNRQPQDQAGHYTQNELSVGQQEREEEQREDCKVCPPTLGIKATVPWLRSETTQHHHHREMSTTMYEIVGSRSKEVLKERRRQCCQARSILPEHLKLNWETIDCIFQLFFFFLNLA